MEEVKQLFRRLERIAAALMCGFALLVGAVGIAWTLRWASRAPRVAGMDLLTSVLFRMYGPPNYLAATPTFIFLLGLVLFVGLGQTRRRRRQEWPD